MTYNQLKFEGLGTSWWIEPLNKNLEVNDKNEIIKLVREFENNYSRFKPDSILSKSNNDKIALVFPEEFKDMLVFALKMYKESRGIFNISVGSELEKQGYGQSDDRNSKISDDLQNAVKFDNGITLDKNTRIDFGGFGKGWLIDKLGEYLIKNGYDFVINGGGDILVNSGKEVELVLEHPTDKELMIGKINISKGAMAGSSTIKRQWLKNGQTKNHIINPKNPKDSLAIIGGFVTAPAALIADVLSTVFLIAENDLTTELAKKFNAEFMTIDHNLNVFKSPGFMAELY